MKHFLAVPALSVAACCAILAQAPVAPAVDPAAAILAAQKKIDDEYARALMSPFTAVAVRYLEPGRSSRLGVDAAGAVFDPEAPMADMIDVALEAGAFWITPVAGSRPPIILAKSAEGDVVVAPGTPVTAKTKISDRDVIGLGRYFVESFARADSGNVRVFDPGAAAKKTFAGLKWFPPNTALQVKAGFVPYPIPEKVIILTSRGLQKDYYRVGTLTFTVDGKTQRLTALSVTAAPKPGDELFVPFRDATTGVETYEVGRYLTPRLEKPGTPLAMDFNAATNPLCNYSPHYNCPIPPKENVLGVAIRAGEIKYPARH